jgi:hypothetical protein
VNGGRGQTGELLLGGDEAAEALEAFGRRIEQTYRHAVAAA